LYFLFFYAVLVPGKLRLQVDIRLGHLKSLTITVARISCLLADRRARSMTGSWHHNVVCLSVCNTVHCGSQRQCVELKVVPSCPLFLAGNFLFTSSVTKNASQSGIMAKRVENTGGTVRRQCHSLRTESTSGVNTRCKQTVSNTEQFSVGTVAVKPI